MAGSKTAKVEDGVEKVSVTKVAPDGGWGWFIVAAFAIYYTTGVSISQTFGLVFAEEFRRLKLSETAVSSLMNINYSVMVCVGLFNGPLLRTFSYRQVALFGSVLMFIGIALTATAASFWQFLVYYGVLMAVGNGLSLAAFTLAINSYFNIKRSVAMGIAMSMTGLGPVIMPHFVGYGVSEFGGSGTSLILAGFSLNNLVASFLLQPVEWHMKRAPVEEMAEEEESMLAKSVNGIANMKQRPSISSMRRLSENLTVTLRGRRDSEALLAYPWWNSGISLETIEQAQSADKKIHCIMEVDEDELDSKEAEAVKQPAGSQTSITPDLSPETPEPEEAEPKLGCFRTCFQGVVRFFDLDLLRDPIYVSISLGLALATFAELNFVFLMPFILRDRHLTTRQTAVMLSSMAAADTIFRFLAPFIGKAVKMSSRVMYTICLALAIVTRTSFIFAESYTTVFGVMFCVGIAKGVRIVCWALVLPEYVPLERLSAASGIQSVTNGIIFIAFGPLLGFLRDKIGSYNPVITILNCISALTMFMWTAEMTITRIKEKQLTAQ